MAKNVKKLSSVAIHTQSTLLSTCITLTSGYFRYQITLEMLKLSSRKCKGFTRQSSSHSLESIFHQCGSPHEKIFLYFSVLPQERFVCVWSSPLLFSISFTKNPHMLLVICSKQYMQHNIIKYNTNTNYRNKLCVAFYTEYF